jgi:hypothetical protein
MNLEVVWDGRRESPNRGHLCVTADAIRADRPAADRRVDLPSICTPYPKRRKYTWASVITIRGMLNNRWRRVGAIAAELNENPDRVATVLFRYRRENQRVQARMAMNFDTQKPALEYRIDGGSHGRHDRQLVGAASRASGSRGVRRDGAGPASGDGQFPLWDADDRREHHHGD